jgi:hypothetical protein
MEITIKDYIAVSKLTEMFKDDEKQLNRAILKHFKFQDLSLEETQKKMAEIQLKMTNEESFYPTFKHKGVEYGFIPNLDKITTGEYIDIDIFQSDVEELHKLMAVLYRPVTKKYKGKYDIEKYDPDNNLELVMLDVNVKYFLGAIVFFCTLSNQLCNAIAISTQNEILKLQSQQTNQNS